MDARIKSGHDECVFVCTPILISNSSRRSQTQFRDLAAGFARGLHQRSPSPIRGRGECRAPDAPAASCAHGVVSMHTSIHSEPPESPGIPARNGLRLIPCSPRRSAFLSPSSAENWLVSARSGRLAFRKLDAGVEASGPHVFAVRVSIVRLHAVSCSRSPKGSPCNHAACRHCCGHRIPPRVRDDREPPLCWDGTANEIG